ncbi:MAG: 4-alpha-glucanotransferase [Clostridia bacterium]|nr:4-alpha-glucanotransferase [Clostridia bacterium]
MSIDARSSGMLMHVSSLPGPFGVGVLGREALDFVDFISQLGFSSWQIVPLNPINNCQSPYKISSAFAGNYVFIDPRSLKTLGLVSQEEVDTCIYAKSETAYNYDFAAEKMLALLKVAFSRISNTMLTSIDDFSSKHKWIEPYSLYMAIRESQGGAPWWEWTSGYDDYEYCKLQYNKFTSQINFWKFTQYIFYSQWSVIKNYANIKGIKIIEDMPFHVSMDSADVWSNSYYFRFDINDLKSSNVSSDTDNSFLANDQACSNPLYNWDNLEDEGFSWWISRLKFLNNNFDIIKITNFKSFESYLSIPPDEKITEREKWVQVSGQNFFKAIKNSLSDINLIANDLGNIEDDVIELLNNNNIYGVCAMQLGFEYASKNDHLPHNYTKNTIAYLGTHDNKTFIDFLHELATDKREFTLNYCGFRGEDWATPKYDNIACRCAFEALWRSPATLTIINIKDICGMTSSDSKDLAGKQQNNWYFRVASDYLHNIDGDYFKRINEIFKR